MWIVRSKAAAIGDYNETASRSLAPGVNNTLQGEDSILGGWNSSGDADSSSVLTMGYENDATATLNSAVIGEANKLFGPFPTSRENLPEPCERCAPSG